MTIGCAIVGGTGYGAKEFLRLALQHPYIKISSIVSHSSSGELLSDQHPELSNLYDIKLDANFDHTSLHTFSHRFVILGLPHRESVEFVKTHEKVLSENNIHVIDLSGDFRIKDLTVREKWYGKLPSGVDESYQKFTYGLTELNRDSIKKAIHIANPGCYATASLLAILPLVQSKLKIASIVLDGKSGSSGAGKTPNTNFHHPELHGNSFAYSVLSHRHEAEIREHASISTDLPLMFTPHVIPLSRGMLVSAYLTLDEKISDEDLKTLFIKTYSNCPFIRLRNTPPHIRHVAGSNFCDIYVKAMGRNIAIITAIDNLIKGMAGQAIQNINCMSEVSETTGLMSGGLGLI